MSEQPIPQSGHDTRRSDSTRFSHGDAIDLHMSELGYLDRAKEFAQSSRTEHGDSIRPYELSVENSLISLANLKLVRTAVVDGSLDERAA